MTSLVFETLLAKSREHVVFCVAYVDLCPMQVNYDDGTHGRTLPTVEQVDILSYLENERVVGACIRGNSQCE